MTIGNAGITGTEFSPIGSTETLGKDGPASNFSVIRQKGDSFSRGAAETTHKQCACHRPKTDEKNETSTEG